MWCGTPDVECSLYMCMGHNGISYTYIYLERNVVSDSPFASRPNFDPALDAAVAAWVLATQRKDWTAMTAQEQALAYMDFLVQLPDEDIEEFERAFPAR